ncbi:MAG: archaetidylserine decarboxylase, partial [Pseudohongiellaceae bacterium]
PIDDADDILVSPADGVISAIGDIANDLLIQAKGKNFELLELVGGDTEIAEVFREGSFVTVYLSPKDYHRVHMPLAGTLRKMVYVPGKLFSVNQTTSERIQGLFARNERAICIFDTDMGPLAVILVGAMIVAGIDTVWSGQVTPAKHGLSVEDYSSQHPAIQLGKGEELGRFRLGSTVILLAGPGALDWAEGFVENSAVQMGSMLAKLR